MIDDVSSHQQNCSRSRLEQFYNYNRHVMNLLVCLFLIRLSNYCLGSILDPSRESIAKEDFDCQDVSDGVHADPFTPCSQSYYACSHGQTSLLSCSDGLFFDKELKTCNRFKDVYNCIRGFLTLEMPESLKLIEGLELKDAIRIQAGQGPISCEAQTPGIHANPEEPCSSLFYVCSNNGHLYQVHCPSSSPATFFDPDNQNCTSFHLNLHCIRDVSSSIEANLRHFGLILGNGDGSKTIFPHPDLGPEDGRLTELDEYLNITHEASHAVICILGADIGEEGNLTQELTNLIGAHMGDITDVKIVTPYNLKIVCSEAASRKLREMIERSTEAQEPGFVHDGRFIPIIGAYESTSPSNSNRQSRFCKNRSDGNYRAGLCRPFYYVCVNDELTLQDCPGPTVYDQVFDRCDMPQYLPQCGGKRLELTTSPPDSTAPQPECSKNVDGLYAMQPRACSGSYFSCKSGKTHQLRCPGNLRFNHHARRCDFKIRIPACLDLLRLDLKNVMSVTNLAEGSIPPTAHFLPSYRFFWGAT